MTDTQERVNKILIDHLGVSEADLRPETLLQELDVDSLDTVELAMAIEQEFGIEVEDADAERLTTVKEMWDYVDQQLATRTKG